VLGAPTCWIARSSIPRLAFSDDIFATARGAEAPAGSGSIAPRPLKDHG